MSIPGNTNIQITQNGSVPCEGSKSFSFALDFTTATEYDFDFTQQFMQKQFTSLQCMFADNSQNTAELTVTCQGSGQTLVIPPQSNGIIPLFCPGPPKLSLVTTGNLKPINVSFLNFYLPPSVWKTT